jgi:HNH endonuclease
MTNLSDFERRPGLKGEKNSMWKGGKSVASNGYVLIRVGRSHPLSDIRGYAYEHRLVASKKLGRIVESHEHIHHINGNKLDNRAENLEVLTAKHHRFMHRKENSNLKLPNQRNKLVECACGCKASFLKFDENGRPRLYISGHNTSKLSVELVLDFIAERAVTVKEISSALGCSTFTVNKLMSRLQNEQKITRFKCSKYCQTQYAHIHCENPLVYCACGCGEKFTKYDSSGRLRKYKSGHNTSKRQTSKAL